jgi:hypothetical protein
MSISPAGAQVTCAAPRVTDLAAGIDDNFALPSEPASPSAELLKFLADRPPVFDQASSDFRFGHTFTGIPSGVMAAELTLHLRARGGNSDNDGLALDFVAPNRFVWNASIAALTGKKWNTSTDEALLVLDLANLSSQPFDILSALADGTLDVYVQDDTAVDFMTLRVTYCEQPPPSSDSCLRPLPGLVAWWTFDEKTGTTVADIAGHHDGVHIKSPTPTGSELVFDGDDGVRVPDTGPTSLDFDAAPGGDFSIEVMLGGIDAADTIGVLSLVDKRKNGRGYKLYLYAGQLGLQLADGTFTNYGSGITVPDDSPHTVAVTVDRSEVDGIRFYLDGREVGPRHDPTLHRGSLINSGDLLIGVHDFTDPDFRVFFDEVRIFNRVLSSTEIETLHNSDFFIGRQQCKWSLHSPGYFSMCPEDTKADIYLEICNHESYAMKLDLTFGEPEPPCSGAGPPSFTPQGFKDLPVPQGCMTVGVAVARPPDFHAGFVDPVRCFEVTATDKNSGQVLTARTVMSAAAVCATTRVVPYFEIPFGDVSVTTLFSLNNPSAAPVTLPYEIEALPAESGGVPVSLNGLEPGEVVTGQVTVPARGTAEVAVDVELLDFQPFAVEEILLRDTQNDIVLASAGVRSFAPGCTPGPTTLCLNDGRFQVSVAWRDFAGNTGLGQAVPLSADADTGYFWFFSPANVELVLKVLDGRGLNDRFWVFYGALSTVEYVITVTDTETGNSRTFFNPLGHSASVADTSALPGSSAAASASTRPALEAASCIPSPTALCLNGRFRAEVAWEDFQGNTGAGQAVPLTSDAGYFWFFSQENAELALKVLDGTPLNQSWWVFYGGLSTVQYRLTVTDTLTGKARVYFNPKGTVGSAVDTSAFSE